MYQCQWIGGIHGGWTGQLRLHNFQCTIAVVQRIVGEGFFVPFFIHGHCSRWLGGSRSGNLVHVHILCVLALNGI